MKTEVFDGKLWKVTYDGNYNQHKRMELIGDAPTEMTNEAVPEPSEEVFNTELTPIKANGKKELKKKKREE